MAKMYKVSDEKLVMVYGFKTAFGGGKSTGFGLIYDNMKSLQAYEPRYRLSRIGLFKKAESSRKQRKERKNKANCVVGVKKAEILRGTGKK
jgi:small subunit ribosomal protein S24e